MVLYIGYMKKKHVIITSDYVNTIKFMSKCHKQVSKTFLKSFKRGNTLSKLYTKKTVE